MAVASCLNCGAPLPNTEPGRIVSCPKCNYEQRVLAPPREERRRSDDGDAAATHRERKAREKAQAAGDQRAPAAAPAAPPGPPATPPREPLEAPRRRMFVKAVLLALVAAGMALYYLTNRPPDTRPPPTPPAPPAAAEAPTVRPLTLAELRSLDREGEVEVAAGDPAGGFAAFDPALNIPWATMIAQGWSTDCVLSTLELRGVAPSGVLPVASDGLGSARYRFFSPERRRRAARENVPAGTPPLLTDLDLVVSAGKLRVSLAPPADPARLDLFGQVMLDTPAPPQGPCPLPRVMELLRAKRLNLNASSHELRLLNPGQDDAWVWLDVRFPEYPVPAEGCGTPDEAPVADESPATPDWRPAEGCRCSLDLDGLPGDETLQLAVFVNSRSVQVASGAAHVTLGLGWLLNDGSEEAWELPVTAHTAPPGWFDDTHVELGIACRYPWVVFVAGDRVTAWSVADRSLLRTERLEYPFVSPAAPPPDGTTAKTLQQLQGQPFTAACTTLELRGDVLQVPNESGVVGWVLPEAPPPTAEAPPPAAEAPVSDEP